MPAWTYPVLRDHAGHPVVVDVHDGDTVRLVLDAGCEASLHPWLRITGLEVMLDTPELGTPGAAEAAQWVRDRLLGARSITATLRGRSFGRWVAVIMVDGADLAAEIIAAGHGRPMSAKDAGEHAPPL